MWEYAQGDHLLQIWLFDSMCLGNIWLKTTLGLTQLSVWQRWGSHDSKCQFASSPAWDKGDACTMLEQEVLELWDWLMPRSVLQLTVQVSFSFSYRFIIWDFGLILCGLRDLTVEMLVHSKKEFCCIFIYMSKLDLCKFICLSVSVVEGVGGGAYCLGKSV